MRQQICSILVFCALAAVVFPVGCGPTAVPGRNPKVTRANFNRIVTGMSMDEVKAILDKPWKTNQRTPLTLEGIPVSSIYEWNSGVEEDTRIIELGFRDGKVIARRFSPNSDD